MKVLLLLLILVATFPAKSDTRSLKVGVLHSSVTGYTGNNGQPEGFEAELAQLICQRINADCQIRLQSFPDNLKETRDGLLDFALSFVFITEERKQDFLFSQHYMSSASVYIGLPEQPDNRLIRVGVVRNSVQAIYLANRQSERQEAILFDNTSEAYLALKKGTVDQVLAPSVIQLAFISEYQGDEFELLGDPLRHNNLGGNVAVILPKGSEKRLQQINDALTSLLTDGSYNLLNKKYFPFSVY